MDGPSASPQRAWCGSIGDLVGAGKSGNTSPRGPSQDRFRAIGGVRYADQVARIVVVDDQSERAELIQGGT
jgi:hypothetical protein